MLDLSWKKILDCVSYNNEMPIQTHTALSNWLCCSNLCVLYERREGLSGGSRAMLPWQSQLRPHWDYSFALSLGQNDGPVSVAWESLHVRCNCQRVAPERCFDHKELACSTLLRALGQSTPAGSCDSKPCCAKDASTNKYPVGVG